VKKFNNWFKLKFFFLYLFGITLLGAGVIFFARSALGAAPWDTAILNLETLLLAQGIFITKGTSSLIHTSFLLVVVLVLQKSLKPLMAVMPMILISLMIDLWDKVILINLVTENLDLNTRILFFILATLLMTSGLATIIVSGFPPNVYDDFHLTVLKVFKIKSFSMGRWIVEFLGLTMGTIYAIIHGQGLGAVSFLSLLLAFSFGFIINIFVKIYKKIGFINRDL
jgi:uncharacterized membrane protein YczE